MLADEVGGGKTFETLAIISKSLLQLSTSQRFRVLILANPSIRSKWEWAEEDNFSDFNSKDPQSEVGKFIQQTNLSDNKNELLFKFFSKQVIIRSKKNWLDIEKPRQGIWLSSFQSLPSVVGCSERSRFKQDGRKRQVFPKNFFDWIIVDEPHALKSGNKDVDESLKLDNSAIRKIYAVLNAAPMAKLLLLTATPFQNNRNELKHLLSLLEINSSRANSFTGIISDGINKLEDELEGLKLNMSISSLKELQHKFHNDVNELLGNGSLYKRPSELQINGCKNGLDDFLRDLMVRNTKSSLHINPVNAVLNEKQKLQYLLFRDQIKDSDDERTMFSTKLSQLVSSASSFSHGFKSKNAYSLIEGLFKGNQVYQCKLAKLLELIREVKISNGKNVITVFVSWIKTVESLKSDLEKYGYKNHVYTLTGSDPVPHRKEVLNKLKDLNSEVNTKVILLASRVGNEGLDFDAFCNRVIHYDNNYNPAVIDQRNGRVYRGSNIKTLRSRVQAKDIEVSQLFLDETYDQRILFIEEEKRKLKDFYLGDDSIHKLLDKALSKSDLKDKEALIKMIESIKIDLTPKKKNLFKKYWKEV
jgi:SNF2 family DNA or RNA helicase